MPVKVSKLWSDADFNSLTNNSKLFYIYLVTNPSINNVGIVRLNLKVVEAQINISLEQIRVSTRELVDKGYVHVKKYDEQLYFIIPKHFSSLPKSDAVITKVLADLSTLPTDLKNFLGSIGISTSAKTKTFVKPSENDVLEYSLSQGYLINAKDFIDYYEGQANSRGRDDVWLDGRGKEVRDWKAKMRRVWFKPERKLKMCKGAPKGYEYLYVMIDGHYHFPDSWKNGQPQSKDFLISKELKKEYERRSKDS